MKPMLFYQIKQRKKNTTISENMGLTEEASNSPTLEETLIHSRPSGHFFKTNSSDLRTRMIYSLRTIFLEDSEASMVDLTGGFSIYFDRDFDRNFAGL
jgi:hypothetical protein